MNRFKLHATLALAAGAALLSLAPRRAMAQFGTPTPSPMPSCTPVPYNQCPTSVESKQVTAGADFTLKAYGQLVGCGCFCQVQYVNPPNWRPYWDPEYLELLDNPNTLSSTPIYPSADMHFRALKAGTTSVTAASFTCGGGSTAGTVTIVATPTETPSPTPSCTPVPYEQCPQMLLGGSGYVGETFAVTIVGALVGCGCECADPTYINPPDVVYLGYDTELIELVQFPGNIVPSGDIIFRGLKPGSGSVMIESSICGGGFSANVGVGLSPRQKGDFDNSGCTNIADFLVLLDNWEAVPPGGGDPVGIADFLALLDNWQTGASCGG